MYATIARFRRTIFAFGGSPFHLMLALICTCAIAVGGAGSVASAGVLYDAATHSQKHRHHHSNDSKNKTPAIVTEGGPLKGFINGNITEFLGIPYAAPPVGALRWTPPQSYGRWHGVLDASSFGNVCTQGGGGSEDCLFLNIYVPNFKKNGNKHGGAMPVMFWIHGGGLISGAGSDYDPTPLVNQGVIVVTINYRLGYLGFFAQTALDSEGHDAGNYGLMDQQFAMGWVQRNIGQFGGDPSNVTIFGESAGGHSVYCNLASPTAAALFAHAISESGSYLMFDNFIQSIVTLPVGETTGSGRSPGAIQSQAGSDALPLPACARFPTLHWSAPTRHLVRFR